LFACGQPAEVPTADGSPSTPQADSTGDAIVDDGSQLDIATGPETEVAPGGAEVSAPDAGVQADVVADGEAVDASPPDEDCMALCQNFFDPASTDSCDATTELRAYWPDQTDCAASCAPLPDVNAQLRFVGCLYAAGCGEVVICETPPAEDFPECEGACDAVFELCGQFGGIIDLATCPQLCTGIFMGFGVINPDAAACAADTGTCGPVPAETSFSIVLECMLVATESCTSACAAVIPCLPEDDPLTQASCEAYCAMGGLGDAEAVAACMAAVGPGSCDQTFACLQPAPVVAPPICAAMCGKLTETCGLPAFACEEGCTDELADGSGVSGVGKVCATLVACGDLDDCQGLAEDTVPGECEAACLISPDTCEARPGGCEAACQGIVTALPQALDVLDCVLAAAGPACALTEVSGCF